MQLEKDQPAAVSLQQKEAHKRNAAALQELMTQADASEPETDDFVADTAADANMVAGDKAVSFTHATEAAADEAGPTTSIPNPEHAESAFPEEPAMPQERTETGRGAGTPAGPLEEFYSPPEHFHIESAEQRDSIMADADIPKMNGAAVQPSNSAVASDAAHETAEEAAKEAEAASAADQLTKDAVPPGPADQSEAVDLKQQPARQVAAAAQTKTPLPAKTPANPKRRKGCKRCSCADTVTACHSCAYADTDATRPKKPNNMK